MSVVNVIPNNLQWIGAAKETTPGTPIAAPAFWIPVDGSSVKWKPSQNTLTDAGLRGMMSGEFQQVAGMRHDTLDYKAYVYFDSVYQHFLAALGRPDAISGASDPFTHKTSLENGVAQAQAQPMTFTLFYVDGVTCWQIAGAKLANLKTTVKVDELATIEASWLGLAATSIAIPTNTPSTSKPVPSWNSVISLGGSALSQYSSIELEYKRDAAEVPTINNSQSPVEMFAGTFTVAGTLTGVYQGNTDVNLVDYLANTQPVLTVKLSPVGDAVHSITLQSTVVAYDSVEASGSNKWMEVACQVKALANATDALDGKQSPAQVIFLSSQSTAF